MNKILVISTIVTFICFVGTQYTEGWNQTIYSAGIVSGILSMILSAGEEQ